MELDEKALENNQLFNNIQQNKPQLSSLQERIGNSMKNKKELAVSGGGNPIITNASALIKRTVYLSLQEQAPDLEQLKKELRQEIENFERDSLIQGIDNVQIMVARYIICTVIDEIVTTTSWGEESEWSSSSLLTHFHDETYGGDRFFSLMDYLLRNPAAFIYIIELMYICLSIGFKGKYRITPNGNVHLMSIKENLFNQIQITRGRPSVELSPNCMAYISSNKNRLFYKIPKGFMAAIILSTIGLVYLSLTLILDRREKDFYKEIYDKNIYIQVIEPLAEEMSSYEETF